MRDVQSTFPAAVWDISKASPTRLQKKLAEHHNKINIKPTWISFQRRISGEVETSGFPHYRIHMLPPTGQKRKILTPRKYFPISPASQWMA